MNPATIRYIKNKLTEYLNLLYNNQIIVDSSLVIDSKWKFFLGNSSVTFHSNRNILFSIKKESTSIFTITWCCTYTQEDVILLKYLLNINIYYLKPFYYFNDEIIQLYKIYTIQRSLIYLKEVEI